MSSAHEVAAGVLTRAGRVLLCRRRPDRGWYPGVWDLVGGHLEAGETAEQALVRECREELAITVLRAEPIDADVHEPGLRLSLFAVLAWSGEPVNAALEEHEEIAWFEPAAALGLRLAHPSYPDLLERVARLGVSRGVEQTFD